MMLLRRSVATICLVALLTVDANGFEVRYHEEITESFLPEFVRGLPTTINAFIRRGFTPEALQEIVSANKATDTGDCGPKTDVAPATPCVVHFKESLAALIRLVRKDEDLLLEDHFDAEKIQEGSNRIFNAIGEIHRHLRDRKFVAARKVLGRTLHGIQDFYAHTNWVDLGKQELDMRLGARLNAFNYAGTHRLAMKSEPTCVGGVRLLTNLTNEEKQIFVTKYGDAVLLRALVDRPMTSGYFYLWGEQKLPKGASWTDFLTTDSLFLWLNSTQISEDIPEVADRDKCRHGYEITGSVQPGIHKDGDSTGEWAGSGRPGFNTAYSLAAGHSVNFFLRVILDPALRKEKNYTELVAGFLGHEVVGGGQDTLVAPGYKKQTYTPYRIDLSDYESGVLIIEVQLGKGESAGSFDLYPAGMTLPTDGDPIASVAHEWDVRPGSLVTLRWPFSSTPGFTFGATGNWFSRPGSTNTFAFIAYVQNGTRKPR